MTNEISSGQLRQYIEAIENLEEEKAGISKDIAEKYSDAKSDGFDPKIMKQIVKLRKMKPDERFETETLLDMYKSALGID